MAAAVEPARVVVERHVGGKRGEHVGHPAAQDHGALGGAAVHDDQVVPAGDGLDFVKVAGFGAVSVGQFLPGEVGALGHRLGGFRLGPAGEVGDVAAGADPDRQRDDFRPVDRSGRPGLGQQCSRRTRQCVAIRHGFSRS